MDQKAFQDYYPEDFSHCYGCGCLNENGHQIKSYWDGDESVCRYTPEPDQIALPGFVYGGLIASIVDCHGTGTAAAASYKFENRELGSEPPLRFVTASLKVDYKAPTPAGVELELRGKVVEITEKKVIVEETIMAGDTLCATGRVIAVKMPDTMGKK